MNEERDAITAFLIAMGTVLLAYVLANPPLTATTVANMVLPHAR